MEESKKDYIKKEVKSISLILLAVLVFRSVLFEPFKIPSGSMIPTLMIGDFILVNKFSYGFKVPFSDINLLGVNMDPVYLFGKDSPKRGDVVVFKFPKDKSVNYIKRVIGLPGDKVEMKNKVVFVNDKPIKLTPLDGKKIMEDMDDKFKPYNFKFYQSKTGSRDHIVQENADDYTKADLDVRIVPKDMYFVMGDNRDFSSDSRYWGYVHRKNIKGKAMFVWFSMIFPWNDNPSKFRPWRIGTKIK